MFKRKKDLGEMGVNLGIIITPMLDMAFQVLAFFIMTYHPSALEGYFDIKMLPPEMRTEGPRYPLAELPMRFDELVHRLEKHTRTM